jgi:hypothetical protein
MEGLIGKLTPEQALEVIMRLTDKEGTIRDAVLAEAGNVLSEIDLDQIADDVFLVLDSIDVRDCWDRAGNSRDGYTAPDEAAVELIEAQLQPFFDQAGRYPELGMTAEEATYCGERSSASIVTNMSPSRSFGNGLSIFRSTTPSLC